jgi:ABC-2 type transport system permease protein
MLKIIKSEHIKLKHTFGGLLPMIAPAVILLIALLLTGGIDHAFPTAAWNWWYIMFLPGMLSVLSYLCVKKDKKMKYYNILLLNTAPEKSWIGKIMYCGLGLLFSNLLIFLGTFIGGSIFGTAISPGGGFAGALLLSLSYMWEIPLFLFLSARFGMFASIFSCMALSVFGVVTLADGNFWWTFPASVPIRLMCPTLGILPNGLPIPAGSELYNTNVILPGIVLSLVWFFGMTIGTTLWFKNMEVK